jgi:putative hydrolase of the HAD superfamily
MKVRTVTLDFWGTLILDSPSSDNRYQARRMTGFETILRREGFHFAAAQLNRAYEDSGDFLRRVWSTGRDVPVREHVTAILRSLDAALPDQAGPDVLGALVEAYASPLLLVPPAVDTSARAALERLRQAGITLVIVSNTMRTPGATLRTLLARCELLDCFEHTVFSDEVGVRKPEPEIFQAALRAVGGQAETAVHVGDDPVLDVLGGHAAGLRTVQLVARDAGTPPASERPDRTITGLDELPAAIASLDAE